jgi:histidinol-phosphate aminotransferase
MSQPPTIQGIPDLGPGLRLHLNENTGGCSPKVVEAVRAFDGEALATYPDYRGAVLETAAYLGVDPDRILLTNGLDEGLLLTSIAYLGVKTPAALVELGAPFVAPSGQPEIVVALPAFEPYVSCAHGMGARVVEVPPGPDFAFPVDGIIRAISPNTRIVYVNNPNNPSGAVIAKDDIRRVIAAAGHALVFVDEAYHDFMGDNFLAEAAQYPNVILGRTFSKAHGLAGMRIGVLIAAPEVLAPVRPVTPLFNLNVVAVAALRAALTDTAFQPWYVAQATASKELVYDACERLGLRYWRSGANFVLIDGGDRARTLIDGMIARGVFVRDRTKTPYCGNCFRLTTGVLAHTEKAIAALEDLCAAR